MRIHLFGLLVFASISGAAHAEPPLGRNEPQKPTPQTDLYGDPLPVGAVARLGSIRLRHAGMSDFIFTSGGKTILSAGSDRVLRLWDLDTGRQQRAVKLQGAFGPGVCVTISPNGQIIAAVDKGKIVFWEVDSGKEIKAIPAPKGRVNYLYISPEGTRMVKKLS